MTTIINGRFTLGRVLGSGMQAEVRQGFDNNNNKVVALKIIDKSKLRRRTLEALEREVEIMKVIRHENILRLKAVAMDTTIANKSVAVLVLEIADGGELFEYLMHTKHFEEILARTYFHQLISALEHCHSQNIYHRDIKPENILMSSTYDLKLADFGLGNFVEDENDLLKTECGTRSYMAPEILAHSGYQGDMADIWSAGVVLFIMLLGAPPFEIAARTDWWFNACSLARYDRFWAAHLRGAQHMANCLDAQDLLNRIFVPNPKRRMTLKDILGHPWMQGPTLHKSKLEETMRERNEKIEAIKDHERSLLQRQGGVKCLGSEERKRVDVFKRETMRSVAESLPKYDASSCMPTYGGFTSSSYQFFSHGSGDILQRLTKNLLAIDSTAKIIANSEDYVLDASLTLPGDSFELDGTTDVINIPGRTVSLRIRVFQAPDEDQVEDEDLLVICVQNKSGVITDFQNCFQILKTEMLRGVREHNSLDDLATGKKDKQENDEEEEELCEELGML